MNPDSFARGIEEADKKLNEFLNHKGPVLAGNIAVNHFSENFRKGGFVNNGLNKWKPAKRQGTEPGAAGQYGPLLSGRNHLYRSLIYRPGTAKVTITTPVTYAAIHNEGGTVTPTVSPKMRKFAWHKYYEAGGGKGKGAQEPEAAARWKRLALTKKTKLSIKIPQRKFIGNSAELDKKLADMIKKEITKILKL